MQMLIRFCSFMHILSWFESVLGLKVNLSRLELVPVGEVNNMQELFGVLGCRRAMLPMKYLGHPLGAKLK